MSEVDDEKPIFNKKKRKLTKDEELLLEQERLEKIVLGKQHGLFDAVGKTITDHVETTKIIEEDLEVLPKKAAWFDEDDFHTEIPAKLKKHATKKCEDAYQDLLRRKFQQTVGTPRWASKKETKTIDSDDEDIDETMRCGKLLTKKSSSLRKGTIRIERMEDLNRETRVTSLINAVEFHPTSTVALVANACGIASIIQVDGKTNSKLQTVKFKGLNIDCARFSKDGEQFFVGSQITRHFFYYDMMVGKSVQVPIHDNIGPINMSNFHVSPDGKYILICGKGGEMHLLTAKTKEWIKCKMKMNHDVVDVTFNNDGSTMYSYDETGEIYEWDMKSWSCVKQMKDDGSLKGIKIALSNNNQILATGSSTGIVNLYEMPVTPTKSGVMNATKVTKNLVTPITALQFNSTSEILAIASNEKKNALRLIHFPSMTAFNNFPCNQLINIPRVLNFSPSSGYFAVGNSDHKVLLYKLKHYETY